MFITLNFIKSKKIISILPGDTLFQISKKHGISIPSSCEGNGLCGWCKVRILKGNDLMDISAEEYNILSDEEIEKNYRLACSFIPREDISIDF